MKVLEHISIAISPMGTMISNEVGESLFLEPETIDVVIDTEGVGIEELINCWREHNS